MRNPQPGIFAVGTASHAYLEFDASAGSPGAELVTAIASLREPRTTMEGVNLVAGFRPELWREVAPDDAPAMAHKTTIDLCILLLPITFVSKRVAAQRLHSTPRALPERAVRRQQHR